MVVHVDGDSWAFLEIVLIILSEIFEDVVLNGAGLKKKTAKLSKIACGQYLLDGPWIG